MHHLILYNPHSTNVLRLFMQPILTDEAKMVFTAPGIVFFVVAGGGLVIYVGTCICSRFIFRAIRYNFVVFIMPLKSTSNASRKEVIRNVRHTVYERGWHSHGKSISRPVKRSHEYVLWKKREGRKKRWNCIRNECND